VPIHHNMHHSNLLAVIYIFRRIKSQVLGVTEENEAEAAAEIGGRMTEEIATGTEIDADHEAETERRGKEAGHLVRRREVVVRTEVLVVVEGNLLYAEDSLRQEREIDHLYLHLRREMLVQCSVCSSQLVSDPEI